MKFGNELKKAMVDCGIAGARQLSDETDVSYGKVIRALNSDGSSRVIDVMTLAKHLKITKLEIE